eukprot:TRINITY_DN113313_c0_g1_i1.p1 TRINITY_DN113313_c0_g1~~TRINITY_DN113313_c0_g1_i1.p1  ORF type:complete len:122 (+),score=22.07 TRINITY_DN113313_c0_g1_i1:37-402(+)
MDGAAVVAAIGKESFKAKKMAAFEACIPNMSPAVSPGELAAIVNAFSFKDDKEHAVALLAAKYTAFTSAGLVAVLEALSFKASREAALKAVVPHVRDRWNKDEVKGALTFKAEKDLLDSLW